MNYDPLTLFQRDGVKNVNNQRVDFMMVLPKGIKLIIEIDGYSHFTKDNKPDLDRYTENLVFDRTMYLKDFKVIRFGSSELDSKTYKTTLYNFFHTLFGSFDFNEN